MKTTMVLLMTLVALVGCISITPKYFDNDKRLATRAIDAYHDAYNREAYHEIFEASHPDAKATKSKEGLVKVLSEMRAKMGDFKSSKLVHTEVSLASVKERQVELIFNTRFENGVQNEVFLVITDDIQGRLHTLGIATDEEVKDAQSRSAP